MASVPIGDVVPDQLAQIVDSVFQAMLGMEAIACDAAWFPGVDRLTSVIQLTGEHKEALMLECDPAKA